MNCTEIHLKEHFAFLGQDGKDPVLTAYLPYDKDPIKCQDKPHPTILLCPGGGYSSLSKREGEAVALKFLPEGYNVFILTYSVPGHAFPTQIREVAAAMELIYQNAGAWRCDTQRIAIMGFSAGGHLAAHYTNAYDCPEVRAVFPESKAVNACILCYPVITGDPEHAHKGSFKHLAGHDYPMSDAELDKFSCDRLVSEKTPPTFVWHCATDEAVPVANSLLYAAALNRWGVPFALHIYHTGEHGMATADAQTYRVPMHEGVEEACQAVKNWIPTLLQWLKDTF